MGTKVKIAERREVDLSFMDVGFDTCTGSMIAVGLLSLTLAASALPVYRFGGNTYTSFLGRYVCLSTSWYIGVDPSTFYI